jgi:hypothetical protein
MLLIPLTVSPFPGLSTTDFGRSFGKCRNAGSTPLAVAGRSGVIPVYATYAGSVTLLLDSAEFSWLPPPPLLHPEIPRSAAALPLHPPEMTCARLLCTASLSPD